MAELRANLAENCIPESMLSDSVPDYDAFLEEPQVDGSKVKDVLQGALRVSNEVKS